MKVDLARICYRDYRQEAEGVLTSGNIEGLECKPHGESLTETFFFVKGDMLFSTGISLGRGSQVASVDELVGLVSGNFFAAKIISNEPLRVARVYKTLSRSPGVVKACYVFGKYVIEPRYQGTLLDLLAAQRLESVASRVDAMYDIAIGLQSIHTTPWEIHSKGTNWIYLLYHGNVKPGNIFYDGEHFLLGDFGNTGDITHYGTSPYMTPPEHSYLAPSKAHHNKKYGQKTDIWKLGLTFAAILQNRVTLSRSGIRGIIPLSFMEEAAQLTSKQKPLYIASYGQESIDKALPAGMKSRRLRLCWKLVGKMLRIDPKERIHIQEVVSKLKSISSEK